MMFLKRFWQKLRVNTLALWKRLFGKTAETPTPALATPAEPAALPAAPPSPTIAKNIIEAEFEEVIERSSTTSKSQFVEDNAPDSDVTTVSDPTEQVIEEPVAVLPPEVAEIVVPAPIVERTTPVFQPVEQAPEEPVAARPPDVAEIVMPAPIVERTTPVFQPVEQAPDEPVAARPPDVAEIVVPAPVLENVRLRLRVVPDLPHEPVEPEIDFGAVMPDDPVPAAVVQATVEDPEVAERDAKLRLAEALLAAKQAADLAVAWAEEQAQKELGLTRPHIRLVVDEVEETTRQLLQKWRNDAAQPAKTDLPAQVPVIEPQPDVVAADAPEIATPVTEPAAMPNDEQGAEPAAAVASSTEVEQVVANEVVIAKAPAIEIPKDFVPTAESNHELYQLHLQTFDGPLDLLLFLIRRHELNIFDIPMAFICEQYLAYLKTMEELNLDVASEFLFMASELLHIKSKMLLPQPEDISEEEEVDPRAELVRRLLEYQKYREAAEQFGTMSWQGRDVFARAPEPLSVDPSLAPLREVGVFALVEAFDDVLKRQKPEVRHHVVLDQISVRQRIRRLLGVLESQEMVQFRELLGTTFGRLDIIVTFLALLEMSKHQLVKVYQSDTGELYANKRFANVDAAMARIEGVEEQQYAG